ncbi:MAG TPA: chemotaxis protein CheX [Anaerolineaceae bacterium]
MNVKFLNPFVEAAYEVLQKETGINMRRGDLGLEKTPYITDDMTVIIAMVGQVQGMVLFGLNQQTALEIVSMMMGEKMTQMDALVQSGVAELGNVITGRASVKLSVAGFSSTISPPTLLLGKGATISTLDFPRLVVPLHSDYGSVIIHLALRENPGSKVSAAGLPVPHKPEV